MKDKCKECEEERKSKVNNMLDGWGKLGHKLGESISESVKQVIGEDITLYDAYRDEIGEFFEGESHFERSKERGFVWVAEHEGFDTLTVEPPSGGQYEIAVRIFNADTEKWSGYHIINEGYLRGINTDGH